MNKFNIVLILFLASVQVSYAGDRLSVVTTLSTYADIAEKIGQDKVEVHYIVPGNQDAHFVRPKPSYARSGPDKWDTSLPMPVSNCWTNLIFFPEVKADYISMAILIS